MKTLAIIGSAFFVAASVAGCAQKMIQKKINVYSGVSMDRYYESGEKYVKAECARLSTSTQDFENILANGGKVVTIDGNWSSFIRERRQWYGEDGSNKILDLRGNCYGKSYIVEGSESVLKDLK